MTLPARVIERDHTLAKSADELMKLRWHWTLDESNAKRVGFSEYARSVGASEGRVRGDAKAWQAYQQSRDSSRSRRTAMPGAAQTPSDFRALGQLSEQKQQAAKAVSRVTGKSVGTVARSKGEEVGAVIAVAQERAERRGTTVESEIEEVAERREKARKTASKLKDEHKERHTAKYIQMEGDLGVAMQRIRKVLNDAEGVKFSAEERELLTEALAKLRALLNLVDLRISGSTDIDWDAELERIS